MSPELRKRFIEGQADLRIISTQTDAEAIDPTLSTAAGTQQFLHEYLLND